MNAFLFLTISQLLCFCLGRLDESEFGRHRIDTSDRRRNRILVVDNTDRRLKQTKQMKQSRMADESFTDPFDVQKAMMELSMSFSLSMSMSMSGPSIPPSPVSPSGPPTINTQAPISFGPVPLPPYGTLPPFELPPSGPPGPTVVMPPFGVLFPSGQPVPTALPPSGPMVPPFGVLPPSGPPGPTGQNFPTGPTFPVPLPPTGAPFTPPTPQPISSGVIVQPSDPPQTEDPTASPITAAPTKSPTASPSQAPSVSAMPTGENDCPKDNALTLGTAADEDSTPVALDMSYSAESNSSSIEDFEEELVEEFIRTAVLAIFGCIPDMDGKISPNTFEIIDASCDPTVDLDNECFVMQTTFIIGVEGPVNTDVAAYDVYKAIQDGMANGNFTNAVEDVVFLEFLSPQPLIRPPESGGANPPNGVDDGEFQRDVDVSPWTIGFSVASVMGGFVSLLVWARSRRSRQNSLDRMEDTTPWVNPETETVL